MKPDSCPDNVVDAPVSGEPRVSVIMPVLNEAETIVGTLQTLQPLRDLGHQVIIVDGGSDDSTVALAKSLADSVLYAPKGRASQMRAGVAVASGDVFWFVHADTRVTNAAIDSFLSRLKVSTTGWGRFDVRLSGNRWLFRLIERLINLRSCLTGIATGDQAMFVSRTWYEAAGGWPDIPLMEDVAFSKTLRRRARPLCLHSPVMTSSRRWEQHGIVRTVLLMWRLRLAYALGVSPDVLARQYAAR